MEARAVNSKSGLSDEIVEQILQHFLATAREFRLCLLLERVGFEFLETNLALLDVGTDS